MKKLPWPEEYRITSEKTDTGIRILSVDALRGFDMFWIMGGEIILKSLDLIFHTPTTQFISTQLDHVEWFGFRFYDIIMPLFVFLAGVSMPFSYSKRLSQGNTKASLWPHIIKRFVILWILGMAVQGNLLSYDINQIKFYSNTLQAIAAGYLIASVLVLYFKVSTQILLTVGLLIIFWVAMAVIPVPGFGAGVYTPEGNLAIYIDKLLMGKFQDGTTYTWILSSLNFGATAMLGVFAGYILRSKKTELRKTLILFFSGICFIIFAKVWDLVHPIIKHIWTGSFVFFSGGLCYLLLAFFYLIIDCWKFKRWSKAFIIIGSNAIVGYTAWHLFNFGLVADVFVAGLKPFVGDCFYLIKSTIAFLAIFLILRHMYIYKIFIKV